MDSAIFIGLANQTALRRQMDVVAHNVANMNTTAYKKENVVFRQFLMDAPNAAATVGGKISYMLDYGVLRNVEEGSIVRTGNPLDLYIDGKGYLAVQTDQGDTAYTRNGRMEINAEGFLTTYAGDLVLSDAGAPIQIEAEATLIGINETGVITGPEGEIARLGLYSFDQEEELKRRGNSLYDTIQNPVQDPDNPVLVKQYSIEASNVNPVEELVQMTRVLRQYQSAQKHQDDIQRMRQDTLERLAKVN